MPGLSVESAAAFGEAISAHFAERVLPYPHVLEFEKIYMPFVLYKKKMYCGMKFEGEYGPGAKCKKHYRGLAVVRRDNARLVRSVLDATSDVMLRLDAQPADVVDVVAQHIALVEASARSMHEAARPADHLPMEAFVLSAGISKDLDSYKGPDNSAAMVARRLMAINPLDKVGAQSRVSFVICQPAPGARRAEQAELVSDVRQGRLALDARYYADAVRAKCEPLLSAMFVRRERERATERSVTGELVVVAPRRRCDKDKLPGELEAQRQLTEAVEAARRARAAAEPRGEKRSVDAFAALRAGAVAASKKRKAP
jgi:DNA polymerase elongation subunit (family B)